MREGKGSRRKRFFVQVGLNILPTGSEENKK
jgi:hypothetical protein